MKSILVTMKMDVEDNAVEELKKTIDHHIEGFVDTESYPEIKSIYDARLEVYEEPVLKDNLFDLYDQVNDILDQAPEEEDCTGDEDDLYAELTNIKTQLQCMGYYTR